MTLYLTIKNDQDAWSLQHDLDLLCEWEARWLMELHPDKCEVISVTRKKHPTLLFILTTYMATNLSMWTIQIGRRSQLKISHNSHRIDCDWLSQGIFNLTRMKKVQLPINHSWTLWTGGYTSSQWEMREQQAGWQAATLVANERTAGRLIANECNNCDYNECTRQYNLSVDFNKNVNLKWQNVESKMEKMSNPTLGILSFTFEMMVNL